MYGTLEKYQLYLWIPIVIAFVLVVLYIYKSKKEQSIFQWIAYSFKAFVNLFLAKEKRKSFDEMEIYKSLETAGYSYDPYQDIFYSNMDAWQRDMGYCRLYDEAAAPLSMIIDCEPIYFDYQGKKWLIEFWKGQYGMTTGCEIGVYTTEEPRLIIPDVFNGTFYNSVSDEELLKMECSLQKEGHMLFKRKGKHWWLTGFKLGEFSEPSDLLMHLKVTLKDETMRNAFVAGLKKAGYKKENLGIRRNTVSIVFDKPHTSQPVTRIAETDRLTQRKNKLLCDRYQDITKGYDDFPDKIKAIQEQAPEIYDRILDLGKAKPLFKSFNVIKEYLSK